MTPYLLAGARFDSNPRYLRSDLDPQSAWGTLVDLRLPILWSSERGSASLTPRAVFSFYPDDEFEDLEDRDYYLTGSAGWNFRKSVIGAGYGYKKLSLRTSELQDPGDSSPGGSGGQQVFTNDDQQDLWYVRPYWQYQLSTKNRVFLNGGYEDVRYDETIQSRRFDYEYKFTTAGFNHSLNLRHRIGLQARWSNFKSENSDFRITNDSETNNLSIIYDYFWSDSAQLSANIGWARTKNTIFRPNFSNPFIGPYCEPALIVIIPCEIKSDSNNFVGNVTLTKQSQSVDYRVRVGQSITPNSNGSEVLRFSVDASANRKMTARLTGKLGLLAFRQQDVGETNRDFERDYIRARLRFDYRIRRNWSFYGSYAYTFNEQNRSSVAQDGAIRNHFLSAGITYNPDGWRW